MIRINKVVEGDYSRLIVEGTLSADWVDELRKCWAGVRETSSSVNLSIDLSGVSYIDDRGKELLKRMFAEGAELLGAGVMTRAIIEEIVDGPDIDNDIDDEIDDELSKTNSRRRGADR